MYPLVVVLPWWLFHCVIRIRTLLLYTGLAAGGHFNQSGSGFNFQCLHPSPTYLSFNAASHNASLIYKAQYQTSSTTGVYDYRHLGEYNGSSLFSFSLSLHQSICDDFWSFSVCPVCMSSYTCVSIDGCACSPLCYVHEVANPLSFPRGHGTILMSCWILYRLFSEFYSSSTSAAFWSSNCPNLCLFYNWSLIAHKNRRALLHNCRWCVSLVTVLMHVLHASYIHTCMMPIFLD